MAVRMAPIRLRLKISLHSGAVGAAAAGNAAAGGVGGVDAAGPVSGGGHEQEPGAAEMGQRRT